MSEVVPISPVLSSVEGAGAAFFATPPPAAPACARTRLDLVAVARKLELQRHTRRTIIFKLRVLVDREGFPLPLNPRIVDRRRLTGGAAVCAASIWHRDEVEAWIEGDQPPPAAAAALRRDATRRRMAERARVLASDPCGQAEAVA